MLENREQHIDAIHKIILIAQNKMVFNELEVAKEIVEYIELMNLSVERNQSNQSSNLEGETFEAYSILDQKLNSISPVLALNSKGFNIKRWADIMFQEIRVMQIMSKEGKLPKIGEDSMFNVDVNKLRVGKFKITAQLIDPNVQF